MAKRKKTYGTVYDRQDNARGYGLARDVQAGQARPVIRRRPRTRAARTKRGRLDYA